MNTFLFFNISGGEVMVIFMFVLIFFGSKRIPEMARTFGRTIRQVRQATDQIKRDIEHSARDIKNEANENVQSFKKTIEENNKKEEN